jgi:hypothetical protein
MLFQRPGQLRFAHWEDLSFDDQLWRCPPEKMKLREWQKRDSRTPAHLVPIPRQGMEILREIYPLTGPTGPIFRNMAKRSEASRYMSDNTINSALRTLGYCTQEDITGHGFRATARTLIRELLRWDADVIERHLAHVSDEELGGSYDRATFLVQRREMVQQWADLLDELAAGNVPSVDPALDSPVRAGWRVPAPRTPSARRSGLSRDAEALRVVDPSLQSLARPPRGARAQAHRRGEAAFCNAPVDGRSAEGGNPHHVAQSVEGGRSG